MANKFSRRNIDYNVQASSIGLLESLSPEEKLKEENAIQMVEYYYRQGGLISLLDGKDVNEIELYAEGSQPMSEFREMYKNSTTTKGINHDQNNADDYVEQTVQQDMTGIDWEPIALLVQPLNSAIATVQKQPAEVVCTAIDGLAKEKKQKDRELLENKPKIEAELEPIAAKMGIPKIDIGGAEHNATGINDMPFGLDPNDPSEMDLYMALFYKLKPESAFETVLTQWQKVKHFTTHSDLETRDQFYFGVSSNRPFLSDTTGLPDLDQYLHPKDVFVSRKCKMPDCSDSPAIYAIKTFTISEIYNVFGSEITSLKDLHAITNAWGVEVGKTMAEFNSQDWWNTEIGVIYMEWKSTDQVNIRAYVNGSGQLQYKMDDVKAESPEHSKSFAENTYSAYWVPGSSRLFKIDRSSQYERKKGQEYYAAFSFNIWRSQKKGAVELCIGHVKMAQKAYIKMQHCIIKSKPPGAYVNLAFMKNALAGLNEEMGENSGYDMERLLQLFFYNNIMIGDSDGLSNSEANQSPFAPIPGGVGRELEGYIQTIVAAVQNISRITGINDQLTGQAATTEGLVGTQKLLMNASINAIHYATIAKKNQTEKLVNNWAYLFMEIIREKSFGYRAIEDMIGDIKAELIESLPEVALHRMGIFIEIRERENEKLRLQEIVNNAIKAGTLTGAEALLLERIVNPKDQTALLLLIEKKKMKMAAAAKLQEQEAVLKQIQAQQTGQMQMMQAEQQFEMQKIQADAQVQIMVMKAAEQIGLNKEYVSNMLKRDLQDRRGSNQMQKSLATIQAQAEQKAAGLK